MRGPKAKTKIVDADVDPFCGYDVVVVGAGVAGLYVAIETLKSGLSVLVLEAKDYLGGRIFTHPKHGYECGAARFHDSHTMLRTLLRKYGLKTFPLPNVYDFHSERAGATFGDVRETFDAITASMVARLRGVPARKLKMVTMHEACRSFGGVPEAELRMWRDVFGYTSEIMAMNAYDSVQAMKHEFVGKSFHVVQGGMSQLIDRMATEVRKRGGEIRSGVRVVDVCSSPKADGSRRLVVQLDHTEKQEKREKGSRTTKVAVVTDHCVFAVAARALTEVPFMRRNVGLRTLRASRAERLLRIYAIYPKDPTTGAVWFAGLRRTTTDSVLRHFIPINEKKGLAMVSYTDGKDTATFDGPEGPAKRRIQNELRKMFPDRTIPEPTYFMRHMWRDGSHYWRPGHDSVEVSKQMVQPCEGHPNVYVCGEAYSRKQAWVEGALETAEAVCGRLRAN